MSEKPVPKLNRVPVFYTPAMVADSESFSPSAAKPAAVVDRWQRIGIPVAIHVPSPVTPAMLKLAHKSTMVDGILGLQLENGFGNRSPEVARTLPLTSGAMLAAAQEALRNGRVAVAPVSGFHHAGYDYCGGFCTFNGLIVTAVTLLRSGATKKLCILDFDQHYGDGTEDCIEQLKLRDSIRHFTAGRIYRSVDQAEYFLAAIPSILSDMKDCDLLLYQAGADPHVDDPLGGWLTDDQLRQRDETVFAEAAAMSLPVAWNLAGGYQSPIEKVLRIHDQTLMACARVHL